MNMVCGAAFTGTRAMCATSGGGFSLMVEAFGMAGVTESAVVVGVFSRPGPGHRACRRGPSRATCSSCIHAAQGEFPRVVLAPGRPRGRLRPHLAGVQPRRPAPDAGRAPRRQLPVGQPAVGAAVRHRARRHDRPRRRSITEGEVRDYLRYKVTRRRRLAARAARREGRRAAREQLRARRVRLGPGGRARRGARRAGREAHAQAGPRRARSCPRPSPSARDEADVSIVSFGTTKGPVRDAMAECEARRRERQLPAGRDVLALPRRRGGRLPARGEAHAGRSRTTTPASSSSSSGRSACWRRTSTCTATTGGCSRTGRSRRRCARWRRAAREMAEVRG